MMIKVFMTRYALQQFNKGKQVVVKSGFQNSEDVEVYIELKKVRILYQRDGMVITPKKWYDKLIPRKLRKS